MNDLHIRTATLNDVAHICRIQAACYLPEFLEDQTAFAAKITVSAKTCWLACWNNEVIGYLISLPVSMHSFPQLNSQEITRVENATLLYWHDLAVHPDYRSTGAGKQLIQHALTLAKQQFEEILLIAVQQSHPFWEKFGFHIVHPIPDNLITKVKSFGTDAKLMQQYLK